MSSFTKFAKAVNTKLNSMNAKPFYLVGISKEEITQTYLGAFPEGTNPIYITNTEHDCTCCKSFITNIGSVVTITDDLQLDSVWNVPGLPYPYDVVAKALHDVVTSRSITARWFSQERVYGKEVTRQQLENNEAKTWNHFHGDTPATVFNESPGEASGGVNASSGVFKRGLKELSDSSISDVMDLIGSNSIYRGLEHKALLIAFKTLKAQYDALQTEQQKELFVWAKCISPSSTIRNTVIGTLLVDLSEGMNLEAAVRSFEAKVAPENYKRTTALITPGMIKAAVAKINELGLEAALSRRMASIEDVSINNVLWADRAVKSNMKSGLEQMLMGQIKPTATKAKKEGQGNTIDLSDFIEKVVPTATSMELLFSNDKRSHLMTLTTRASGHDVGEHPLFKWGNDFAWAYEGNVADSTITARVKAAGGQVNADVRVSLAWDNKDDLDLHCITPINTRIYFANRGRNGEDGSKILDVDANGQDGYREDPVENMAFIKPVNGKYRFTVSQYNQRSRADQGFTLEVADANGIRTYSFPNNATMNDALELQIQDGLVYSVKAHSSLVEGSSSQEAWGLQTNTFVPVKTLLRSPNYWDGQQAGNQHFFFILDGCKSSESVRGIFNEFLHGDLTEHRKVFEMLGDKTQCQPTDNQLSGVGFSTTKPQSVVVRVTTEQGKKEYTVLV